MNTVVLGRPYSGALLGFFSDQVGAEYSHTRLASHPYYQALYGPNYQALIDVSVTFLLLYDEVWLCPADTHWPTPRTENSNSSYIYELALHADWERYHALDEPARHWVSAFLHDQVVMRLLLDTGYAYDVWPQIISSAIYEMAIAKEKDCAILCSKEHRILIERLLAIQKASTYTSFSDVRELQFVSSYNEVTGLAFTSKTIDDLLDVKSDAELRKYCRAFLKIARTIGESTDTVAQVDVARLVREAIETSATAKMTGGFLNWVGSVFRPLHDPLISSGIALGSAAITHLGDRESWFQFGGQIDRVLDKRDMIARLDKVLRDK